MTDSSELAGTPHWSPDGSRLIFYTAALDQVCKGGLIFGTGLSQIASVDWKTGERRAITGGGGLKVFPRYVNSNEIAYQTSTGLKFTGGAELLGDFEAPDWSPDGRSMIFHREVETGAERDYKVRPWPSMDRRSLCSACPTPLRFLPAETGWYTRWSTFTESSGTALSLWRVRTVPITGRSMKGRLRLT
ncbi:MAG TPA: hypothetical protein VLI55_07110 [Bryobacteraceae bacterium]|nr:hypothetical protein [Bryobacteraceae bacterium]